MRNRMRNGRDGEPFAKAEREDETAAQTSKTIGERGEELACRFLWRRGLRILERNFEGARGEIDIIAQQRRRIHFVEVKTRTSDSLAAPEERVDKAKQELLRQAAREYLDNFRDGPPGGFQFDVLAQILDGEGRTVRQTWIENAM